MPSLSASVSMSRSTLGWARWTPLGASPWCRKKKVLVRGEVPGALVALRLPEEEARLRLLQGAQGAIARGLEVELQSLWAHLTHLEDPTEIVLVVAAGATILETPGLALQNGEDATFLDAQLLHRLRR